MAQNIEAVLQKIHLLTSRSLEKYHWQPFNLVALSGVVVVGIYDNMCNSVVMINHISILINLIELVIIKLISAQKR